MYVKVKCKDKAIPVLSTTPLRRIGGVEGYLHAFLTSEIDGGEWSASRPGRFTPGKKPFVSNGEEAGWAPKPVWTQ
jgi:hypothetical protein